MNFKLRLFLNRNFFTSLLACGKLRTVTLDVCKQIFDIPVLPPNDSLSTSRYPREAITMKCNPSSYDTMEWFFRPDNQTALHPFPFGWCQNNPKGPSCTLYNKNTSLNIEMISKEANGEFLCVASCSRTGRNTSATIILYVEDCFAAVPEPRPPQNVSVSLKQTATLACRAHVGKCYSGESFYYWFMGGRRLEDNQKYKINKNLDGDDLVTTLTINNVTKEDMTSYNCLLVDDKFVGGNRNMTVFLTKRETMIKTMDSSSSVIILSVVVPIIFFILCIILFAFCFIFCKWHLIYHFCQGKKTDRGTNDYDVLLYKDDDHAGEASRLREELECLMYKVCAQEDSHGGGVMQSLQNLIDSSSCVIFFCNENDKHMDTILSKAQENISVFVIRKKSESRETSELRNKSMAAFEELQWPSHRESKSFCVTWRKDEFYYRLRCGLPRPRADQNVHAEEHIHVHNLRTDIQCWENEMNKL
ncbi:X-linked interleukin-1 receptor accessory protein-like 2 isoform X2 [Saccostrea cucullata]|uniref:X-linked interleukin-1 receptor accessory protein-like 2 isoform X2 n=1 Tax=Saccostrea cuccullata TaxID=36930 RepID=UPI002ED2C49F